MQCQYCNATLSEGAVFCSKCGQKQEPIKKTVMFCSRCGAQMPPESVFCSNCGTKNEKPNVAPVSFGKKPAIKNFTLPQLQIPRKVLLAGLGAVAAVLVILLAVSLFSGSSNPEIIYAKDSQLQFIRTAGMDEAYTLTERLGGKKDMDSDDLLDLVTSDVYGRLKLSEDGKKLFYPDKFDDDSYTLYVQDLSNTKKDPVKIDSGLTGDYEINDKGNLVTYLKDGKLYQHNLKEKTKISSDVTGFVVTDDGSSLLYSKKMEDREEDVPAATEAPAAAAADADAEADNKKDEKEEKKRDYAGFYLYLKTGKKDPVELDEDVYQCDMSEDHSSIYYLIGYDLYLVQEGKDPKKIASDVQNIWSVTNSGGCYYTVQAEDTLVAWDLVEDDVSYQESEEMREVLEDRTISNPVSELYYYNGKSAALIEPQVRSLRIESGKDNFLSYTAVMGDSLPAIALSDYTDYKGSFAALFEETLEENTRTYILQGDKYDELPLENIYRIVVGDKAETLWIMTDYDNKASEVTLHEVKVSGGSVKSVEEIDDEVYYGNFQTDGKNYIYWKSVKDYEGELYCNGKEIADDVKTYGCSWNEDAGKLFFSTDYSSTTGECTLSYWDGRKVTEVGEDVYRYLALGEKCVAYLKDYNVNKQKGDLYVWTGKESEKLDEDVMYILPVYRQ